MSTQIILVVEDDYANQQVATLFLQRFGYEVEIAENGVAAIKATQIKQFPLIFMDCQMPVMDGYEASLNIREHSGPNQFTPIVALTANTLSGVNRLCQDAGMDDMLCKPISLNELKEMTEKWIGKRTSYDSDS